MSANFVNGGAFVKTYRSVELDVIEWATACKIIPNAPPVSQLLAAVSKMGELTAAENKQDLIGIKSAVGDVVASLINYCALHDLDLVECLNEVCKQIKTQRSKLTPKDAFATQN